jgi:3-hydroxyacyl-CoA dehydrogenase
MPAYRDSERIGTVANIGAGVIGGGWGAAFLGHGLAVRLHDPDPAALERVTAHVTRAWPQMVALGLARDGDDWVSRLTEHATLEDALEGADFVQESTPERAEVKSTLFAAIDRYAPPDVIVGSSTSSLPITDLQAGLGTAGRFILGHPFNPVHLIPLVEVGGGANTESAAIDAAIGLYARMGKKPIRIRREIFGHIANRLTSAMFREAARLVAEGYATVGDVDDAIRFGPAPKWAIQGQFTTFHTSGGAGGLADFLDHFGPGIMKRWQTMRDVDLNDPGLRAQMLAQMDAVAGGRDVAEVAARQDRLLMAMLKLLNDESIPEN